MTRLTAKLIAALAFVGLAAGPGVAGAGEVLDRILSSKTLKMATDAGYPPQSFQNADGSFDGFDIDVGREIAKRLGAKLDLVTPAWEIITAGKWGGRWDISVGSMTPTKERARVLVFPAIYYYTPASFAVHTDNTSVKKIEDLNGKVIGACGACTYDLYLQKSLVIDAVGVPSFDYKVTAGEIRNYETDTNGFDQLKLGDGVRLDAVISALPTIEEAIKNGYPMRVVGEPVFYEPLSVAIDKGDSEFAAKLEKIVGDMRADGTLTSLSKKWYGVDLTTVAPTG